jgi:arylsulfatase A-like enzyme
LNEESRFSFSSGKGTAVIMAVSGKFRARNLSHSLLFTFLCLALLLGLGGAASHAQEASIPKPNILVILTDDQEASTLRYMPNVRKGLMEQGKTFDNAIFTDPLCCPSRASIHRGQYPHNTGVVQNSPPSGGWETFTKRNLHRSTVGTWLDDAGYRTAYFGKVMNGYTGHTIPGYDRRYVYSAQGMGWKEITTNSNSFETNPPGAESHVAREALGWLKNASNDDEAFFGVVSFGSPHSPYPHPDSTNKFFRDVALPADPAINEADVSDKPAYVRRLDPIGRGSLTEDYRDALRSLINVDDFVGDALEVVPPDTYVVFWTDNGTHLGYHRLHYGKRTPYEQDISFPLVVKGPSVSPGTAQELVGNHDLAPTIAELAGVTPPYFVDGHSFVPLLGPSEPPVWRDALLIIDERGERGSTPWKAIRTEGSIYVRYDDGQGEYYDLSVDPHELENLYASPDRSFETRMKEIGSCAGSACWAAEGGTVGSGTT